MAVILEHVLAANFLYWPGKARAYHRDKSKTIYLKTTAEANELFETRVKSIVKETRVANGMSYLQLAEALEEKFGTPIDVQVLINRVNQGKYSFVFAMRLLAAMKVASIDVPKPSRRKKGEA